MKLTKKRKQIVSALFLAITAPSQSKANKCVKIAQDLCCGETEENIEACKRLAVACVGKGIAP